MEVQLVILAYLVLVVSFKILMGTRRLAIMVGVDLQLKSTLSFSPFMKGLSLYGVWLHQHFM